MELGVLRHSRVAVLGAIASTPVAAEVCDKVRPDWNPTDGRVNQLEDLILFFGEPLGLIVLALALLAVLFRKIWLTAVVVILLVAIIALSISTWTEADQITNFAILEGCITAPVLTTITLVGIGAILVMATWRGTRSQKSGA